MCIFNLYQRVTFGPGIWINFSTRQGLSTIQIWKKDQIKTNGASNAANGRKKT